MLRHNVPALAVSSANSDRLQSNLRSTSVYSGRDDSNCLDNHCEAKPEPVTMPVNLPFDEAGLHGKTQDTSRLQRAPSKRLNASSIRRLVGFGLPRSYMVRGRAETLIVKKL